MGDLLASKQSENYTFMGEAPSLGLKLAQRLRSPETAALRARKFTEAWAQRARLPKGGAEAPPPEPQNEGHQAVPGSRVLFKGRCPRRGGGEQL